MSARYGRLGRRGTGYWDGTDWAKPPSCGGSPREGAPFRGRLRSEVRAEQRLAAGGRRLPRPGFVVLPRPGLVNERETPYSRWRITSFSTRHLGPLTLDGVSGSPTSRAANLRMSERLTAKTA